MNIAWPIYRRLAAAFPHEFKLAFGDEMMQAGEDAIADVAKRHGILGLVRLIADLLLRLPIEYLNEMRRDLPYAARTLMKSPGYAVVGIVSMGLGIGLTTNVYSSAWALLTRTLPGVANAKQLVDRGESRVLPLHRALPRAEKSLLRRRRRPEQRRVQRRPRGPHRQTRARLRATGLAGLFFRPRHGRRREDASSAPIWTKPAPPRP